MKKKPTKIPAGTEQGMSLLEVIIAIGLMGMLGHGMMSMMKNGSLGQKALTSQDDSRMLTDTMANLMVTPESCEKTFKGLDPRVESGASVPAIKDKLDHVHFSTVAPNNRFGNGALALSSITIGGSGTETKKGINLARWTSTGPDQGQALVLVTFQQLGSEGNQGLGPQQFHRWFMVFVTKLDDGGKIDKCRVLASSVGPEPAETCNMMGGTYDAAATPQCKISGAFTCEQIGGTWTGTTCKFPANVVCDSLGGAWDGSKCRLPSTGGTMIKVIDTYNAGWPGCPQDYTLVTFVNSSGDASNMTGICYKNP